MAFVRSRAGDAPETEETYKDVLRSIDHNVCAGTLVPVEYQPRAGALISLIMHFPFREALLIELRRLESGALWIADAQIEEGDQIVYRRGVGATPVDALVALAFDIQYE